MPELNRNFYWHFSLGVYAREGVAQSCVELQDRIGLDVNVLLLALLAARMHRRPMAADDIAQADHKVLAWRQQVVAPLRKIRRRLKTGPYPAPDSHTDLLRDKLKAAELDAEHAEQRVLAAWLASLVGSDQASDEDACMPTATRVVDFYFGQMAVAENRAELLELAAVVARAARCQELNLDEAGWKSCFC